MGTTWLVDVKDKAPHFFERQLTRQNLCNLLLVTVFCVTFSFLTILSLLWSESSRKLLNFYPDVMVHRTLYIYHVLLASLFFSSPLFIQAEVCFHQPGFPVIVQTYQLQRRSVLHNEHPILCPARMWTWTIVWTPLIWSSSPGVYVNLVNPTSIIPRLQWVTVREDCELFEYILSDHPISSSPGCTWTWSIVWIVLIWSSYFILSRLY